MKTPGILVCVLLWFWLLPVDMGKLQFLKLLCAISDAKRTASHAQPYLLTFLFNAATIKITWNVGRPLVSAN